MITNQNDLRAMMRSNPGQSDDILSAGIGIKVRIISNAHGIALSSVTGVLSNKLDETTEFIIRIIDAEHNIANISTDKGLNLIASGNGIGMRSGGSEATYAKWVISPNSIGFVIRNVGLNKFLRSGASPANSVTFGAWERNEPLSSWSIAISDAGSFCSKVKTSYAFSLPPCYTLPPSPAYHAIAQEYCSGGSGKSRFMTSKPCQSWCNAYPNLCESAMLDYCKANPGASECKCIYANRQQDYLAFRAKYPKISGSASCFTDACNGTNYVDALIPASVAATQCPDITDIKQTTEQTLNVERGATVIGASMSASQTADVATHKTSRGELPSSIDQGQERPGVNYFLIILVLVLFLAVISAIIYLGGSGEDSELPGPTGQGEKNADTLAELFSDLRSIF